MRVRRWVHRGLSALVVGVGVLFLWPAQAGAQEDPDESTTATVSCLRSPEELLPDSVGGAFAELIPIYGQVQSARRTAWMLDWLGVPTAATGVLGATNRTDVELTAVRWYVDEARREAEDFDNCALARHRPTGDCRGYQPWQPNPGNSSTYFEPGGDRVVEPDVSSRRGLLGFLPDKCWGPFPADSYDLHYFGGGTFSADRKVWVTLTGFFHSVGKGAMQVALGALGFAFSTFHTLDYRDFALDAALNYERNLVGPFGLEDMAFLALFGYAAVMALRGKLGIAGGEVLMAVLVGTLAAAFMANRDGYLEGAATTMDDLTVSILAAGEGNDPTTARGDAVWYVRPVQETLFVEFVDRPFDYVNFGGEITDDTCRVRRDRILWAGVNDDGGWGIRYMDGRDPDDTACDAHALAMGRPTSGRMLIALVVMAVCLGAAIVVGGAALVMLVAKILLLAMFAVAPFAAVGATLPALGRRLAWAWLAVVVQALLAAAAMSFVLSLFLLGFREVAGRSESLSPFERWLVMLVIVGIIYLIRVRLLGGTRSVANALSDRLTRLSPGSAHWERRDNGVGLDLRAADARIGRGLKATAGYGLAQAPLLGLAAVGAGAGVIASSWGRWRTGRISLANLRRMERHREDVGATSGRRGVPFNPLMRRLALRRQGRAGHPHVPVPSRTRPGGGGAVVPRRGGAAPVASRAASAIVVPRAPRAREVFDPSAGKWARSPQPAPASPPRPQPAARSGNWVATRWEKARDVLRADRGAEIVSAGWRSVVGTANRGWDRSTAAMGRGSGRVTRGMGVGHPGPGGRSLRASTLERRWKERQADAPANRQPGWAAARRDDRRRADGEYRTGRAAEREAAATFGPGRRRLRQDEREQLGGDIAPRGGHQRAMREWRDTWRNPAAVRFRDHWLSGVPAARWWMFGGPEAGWLRRRSRRRGRSGRGHAKE